MCVFSLINVYELKKWFIYLELRNMRELEEKIAMFVLYYWYIINDVQR